MSVASLSVTTINIERPTLTVDATGGTVKTWSIIATYKCRLQPLSGAESNRHSKDESVIVAKAYISGATNIEPGYRFRVRFRPNTVEYDYLYVVAVRNIDTVFKLTTLELEERAS